MTSDPWSAPARQPSKMPSLLIVYDEQCSDLRLQFVRPATFKYNEKHKRIVSWHHFESISPFIELVEHEALKVEAYAKLYKLIWSTAREAVFGNSSLDRLPKSFSQETVRITRIVKKFLLDPFLSSIFSLNLKELLSSVWKLGQTFRRLELALS